MRALPHMLAKRLGAGSGTLLCLLALFNGSASAQPWQEQEVTLPAPPSKARPLAFDVGAGSELRYTLDTTSIAIGQDGVVRYVVSATSPSGVENVLYEGLRCDTGEATTYARWNSSEQRWTMQASWTWRPISGLAVTRIALKLAQTGMCDGRTPNGPVPRMLQDLERGGRLIGDQR